MIIKSAKGHSLGLDFVGIGERTKTSTFHLHQFFNKKQRMTTMVIAPKELGSMNEPGSPVSTNPPISSNSSASWWPARATTAKQNVKHSSVDLHEQQAILNESVLGDVNLLRRRPERLSIVFFRSSREKDTGLRFRVGLEGSILVDGVEEGCLLDCQNPATKPFFEDCQGSDHRGKLLQVGDVVESINGWECHGKQVSEVAHYWGELMGEICITISAHDGANNSGLCQLVIIQSTKSSIVTTDLSKEQEETGLPEEQDKTPALLELRPKLTQRQGLLQVQGFAPDSCFTRLCGNSPMIESGDFVVAMTTTLCAALDANDAQSLWQMQTESCHDCLSLLTVRTTEAQRRWNRLRKAAVAVGGGTLVGLGTVMLATPLHPVGHVISLGGVGVLGTEFEGPRKVFQAAKDKFRRKEPTPSPEPHLGHTNDS
eukprot:scaffold38287_cov214-Amphora_coffeaeformis.AAC.3